MKKEIKKVYLGSTLIRPSWWQPWANTLGYWKFEQNLNDSSWNGYNFTTSWTITTSYSSWVDGYCIDKTGEWILESTLPATTFVGNFTLMCFVKFDAVNSVIRIMWELGNWSNIQYESWKWGLQWFNNDEAGRTSWDWTPVADTWYHIVITGDGTAYTAYLDWATMNKTRQWTIATGSWWFILWWNSSTNVQNIDWSFDEVIIEDRIWTQAEIQTYLSQFTY